VALRANDRDRFLSAHTQKNGSPKAPIS